MRDDVPAIETHLDLIEDVLGEHREIIGDDFSGYKNHVYRMVNFCFAQQDFNNDDRKKIILAGCFHDIGIWTAGTFDYLAPSVVAASRYLDENGLANWSSQIGMMIREHHKLRRFRTDTLTEVFRRGDLVDFSLGMVKCGIPAAHVRDVRTAFPNAGFHCGLVKKSLRWIIRHPLDPIPVLKW